MLALLQLQPGLDLALVTVISATALLAVIAAFGISYLRVRRISRSVRAITEGVRRLSRGDLDNRVETAGPGDTAQLAEALNRMANALTDTITNLSVERNKLSAVLATMADGVVVLSPEGVVSMLNQAAREMLNLGERDTEGRRLIELARDHQIHRLTSECLSTGEARTGEVQLLRPRRVLNAVATPLPHQPPLARGAEAPAVGVLLTLHDLTRTRQLEASQKEFVSNVSHELRNPLASVKAMVETLEDGAMERQATARDFLKRIHHDVDRMTNLVNELLELSRLESGQLVLKLKPLDLESVFADIHSRFSLVTRERSITIILDLPADLPRVMADADRVQQVLVNLVENAINFTPSNGQITVAARRKSPQPSLTKGDQAEAGLEPTPARGDLEGFIEITVADTGVGISPDDLPHIFERFYKVDRARHAGGGTGLGLAIVKQIVEAHGGAAWARSQEGAGSTFGFTLPAAE